MPKTVILGAARTPFGKMGGGLASHAVVALEHQRCVAIQGQQMVVQRLIQQPGAVDFRHVPLAGCPDVDERRWLRLVQPGFQVDGRNLLDPGRG